MKAWIACLLLSTSCFARAAENVHRLGGYYENDGKKYAVCISLFETFWFSRGIKAFNGYMTYATQYYGEVPLSPAGFTLAGNQAPESGKFIFAVFDQNNPSPTNPELYLQSTNMDLKGDSLTSLALTQQGQTKLFTLRELTTGEDCSLNRPK